MDSKPLAPQKGAGEGKTHTGILTRLRRYGELTLFSHTLFSLPFGLLAMIWAADGLPPLKTFFWILLALVGARNGANAFNRIADLALDKKNPRTSGRPLADGRVSMTEAVILTLLCFGLLVLSAAMLNPLCLGLCPLAIGIFLFYSYTKRFTWLCHFVLGAACGGAPLGAWMAVRGRVDFLPLLLAAAVCLWVAGFDILYATQDIDFDRTEGLHSLPARFGLRAALLLSAGCHVLSCGLLLILPLFHKSGPFYYIGLLAAGMLMLLEHLDLDPLDARRMRFASYHLNQLVSVVFFLFAGLDFLLYA